MTLEWTSIDVPLGAGVDTKTNEKLLKPPACADLSDAIFPATGVSGYETRKGYDRIRTDTSITSIDSLATLNNELLVCGNNKLYSVSELTNNVDLLDKGNLLAVNVQQTTLDTQAVNQTSGQLVTHNNLQVHSWFDSGTSTIQYSVTDATTGARISSNTSLANSTRAKLAFSENSILLIYFNSSAASLRALVIPTYAPTTVSDVELVTDADPDALFDCVEWGNNVFVAYKDDTAPDGLTGILVNGSGSVVSTGVFDTSHDTVCLAVTTTSKAICVVAATATEVDYYHNLAGVNSLNASWTSYSDTQANVINLAYTAENDDALEHFFEKHYVWAEYAGASARDNLVEVYTATGQNNLDSTVPQTTVQHSSIASSAFRLTDNTPLVHLAYDTTLQKQYFLCNELGEVHGVCCQGVGGGNVTAHLPRVIGNSWAPVFREHLQIDVDPDTAETTANVFAQYGLKKVTYDFSYRPVAVEFGEATYINSGVLWQYDGAQLVEQGFHVYPESITTAQSTTGALTQEASYSYRVYYEWLNAAGERQRSTTATIVTHQLTITRDDITLTIPTLAHTKKGTDVSIVVYRTEADPNLVGGAPLYRVSSPNPAVTGSNGYLANDPTVATVDFTDILADTAIRSNELDYLNSGELDHVTTPAASIIGEAKNRVWKAGFEKENRVMYSKNNSRGRDQLEFHDTLWVDLPEYGGPVTAFGELNFHVVVFKENSCYAISGEGKNNLGAGFFNLPQVASLDVGCIEQRSIVNIPAGIMFKSNKGIWLLGHNLDMQYVGANVEAYNDQDVTSATLIPEENHVLFLTSSRRTLLFNYLLREWSTFTNHAGSSALIWNESYTYARVNGAIYRQGENYSDDGVHYAMRFVTAPIGIKGVQGKQKIRHIRLLGEYYSAHDLRLGLRFNHEPGVSDTGTWDPSGGITVSLYGAGAYGAGAYGGDGSPVYQVRFNMPRQKCQTVQFVIDSKNTAGAGRAVSIQAIQVEVGAKRGTGELSVDRSFSATGGSTGE